MVLMTINAVAKETGTDVETIRYYEDIGLVATPLASNGVEQLYDDTFVKRLSFIAHWLRLGSDLDQIRRLMKLVRDLNEPEDQMERMKREMIQDMESQKLSLIALREELTNMSRF